MAYSLQTIKGIEYAVFDASPGAVVVNYGADTTPPVISNIVATPAGGGIATISWTTNEVSDSLVAYGTDPGNLNLSASSPALVTIHSLGLSGLLPNTIYYYRVTSADQATNSATSPEPPAVPLQFTTPNNPPNTPSSPTPADGAVDQVLNVGLSWTGGDPDGDTVTYDVYFEANDNTPDVLVSNDQSGATYDPGLLTANTQYYWQIVATDEHGASSSGPVWAFTTLNNPPNTPSNPSPADGAVDQDLNVDLSWTGGDPDGDTVTYDVYFEANDNTPDVLVSNDQSGATYDPGILTANTQYYWQIVATDEHGASSSGPVWAFTTLNNPPNTPSNPSPADGAVDQDLNVDLSWTGGDPDGDTVTYDVYFEANDNTPDVLVSNDQSGATYDPGLLTANTQYYWQIVATDEHGASSSGPVWAFTTLNNPPNTPSNPSPADGAVDQVLNVDLSWTGGDPDGNTVTYDVYFEANDNTPDVLVSNDQSGITYDPGILASNTQYYWQIVATDEHGASSSGPVWAFTTLNNPPNTPSNPSPADGAVDQDLNMVLSWTGGDPDGDTVTYDVFFSTAPSPATLICDNVFAATCDPGTLSPNTHYYWQVVATDQHGASSSGAIWDFQTGSEPNNPPNTPSSPSPANGASEVSLTAALSWTGGDPDGDTVTYDVYFGTTPSPATLICDNVSAATCDPGALNANTHYYWQVVSTDQPGASSTGPVWDFTTMADVYQLFLPVINLND